MGWALVSVTERYGRVRCDPGRRAFVSGKKKMNIIKFTKAQGS
jgi:hypothetical protein